STHDGEGAWLAVGQSRGSIHLVELCLTVFEAPFDDDFGQLSKCKREVGEACVGLDDMLHIDAEQFLVLETIQGLLTSSVVLDAVHGTIERCFQGGARCDEGCVTILVKQRHEMVVLAAEKILPEKVAGAEQPRQ